MDSKSIFKSRTFYFNVLTILVAIATFYGFTPDQELANKTTTILLVAAPAINLILRLLTKKPIRI